MECAWSFEANAGETIRVVVDTLNLEPYDGLKGDRVRIRNAGNDTNVQIHTEATYEISSSSVSLTLETDKNDRGATYDGFSATAYSVAACPDLRGGDCEDEGFTCEDGYCYDLSGGSKRASGCTCAGCDVGSYLDDATGGCEACPAGTYQPQDKNTVGASSCIACSAGMDAPEQGSALCCSEDYVLVGQKCARVRRGRRGLQAHRHEVRYAGNAHGGDARDREGLLPLQPRGDGRLPVPGEGRRLRGVGPLETSRL